MPTVLISSNNFIGQVGDIIFYPYTGGTVNIGPQLIPYEYTADYIYGTYEVYFDGYGLGCNFTLDPPTQTPTPTKTPTPTNTQTQTPTKTQTSTPTNSKTPTQTSTPTPTQTKTSTSTPTQTPTPVNSVTPTPTQTKTPTQTQTRTRTETPTPTQTQTQTRTPTQSQTQTKTPTQSQTPTKTQTRTSTPTPTPSSPVCDLSYVFYESSLPTPTPTITPTLTQTPTKTNPSQTGCCRNFQVRKISNGPDAVYEVVYCTGSTTPIIVNYDGGQGQTEIRNIFCAISVTNISNTNIFNLGFTPSGYTCANCGFIQPTPTPTPSNIPIVLGCATELIIESIYLGSNSDLSLLPPNYIFPGGVCIGCHTCNLALIEVFGNGISLGEINLNNNDGSTTAGATTIYGTRVCGDYNNTPSPITGGIWNGNPFSRYSKIIVPSTHPVFQNLVNNQIQFTFSFSQFLYNYYCNAGAAHRDLNWFRISTNSGFVIYNGSAGSETQNLNIPIFTMTIQQDCPQVIIPNNEPSLTPTKTPTATPSPCCYYIVVKANQRGVLATFQVYPCSGGTYIEYWQVPNSPNSLDTFAVNCVMSVQPLTNCFIQFTGYSNDVSCNRCYLANIATPQPTRTPTPTKYIPPTINICDRGLIIEGIYLNNINESNNLPAGYTVPTCMLYTIGYHQCNRTLQEFFGNGISLGEINMNNDGNGGNLPNNISPYGTLIYGDYNNTSPYFSNGSNSRYSKIIIPGNHPVFQTANQFNNIISLTLSFSMASYLGDTDAHTQSTWFRISDCDGTLYYNSCVSGQYGLVNAPVINLNVIPCGGSCP